MLLKDVYTTCSRHVDRQILHQLVPDGLGSDLALEAEADEGNVRLKNLMTYLFVHVNGLKVIGVLAGMFS